ncbi:MAG TPA: hypothetical protein PKO09_18255 [Anaerolineae bacterium]|nr:hypothetical protein [Anaerolineae bacterium]
MSESLCLADLPERIGALAGPDRERLERIFDVRLAAGSAVPPDAMADWIARHFGSVDAVRRQTIVRVTNKVTGEGALFNQQRANRPLQAAAGAGDSGAMIRATEECLFCRPAEGTPADVFGRIRGRFCTTASNAAKYDGWHAVIVFDEHDPLRFSLEQVEDYVRTAQKWARRAHRRDPEARYPFFLWNCLWRSGASVIHGHAQMALARGMPYARIEAWRQAALRYRAAHGSDYFADLVAVHDRLGLAIPHGDAVIFPSLTPAKEMETTVVAPRLEGGLVPALYRVLRTFIDRLGVQSFNAVLYQPPLAGAGEAWAGFPFAIRVLDRGSLENRTSDIGSMELFAQSVVVTDPYYVAEALRA